MATHYLDFERPIGDLEAKIEELSKLSDQAGSGSFETEIDALRARVDTVDGTPPMINELVRLALSETAQSVNYWRRWTKDYDYLYVLFAEASHDNPDPEHLTALFTGDRFVLYRIDQSQIADVGKTVK